MSKAAIPQAPTLEELRAAVAELLEVERSAVGDEDDLLRLGMDSLRMMRLVNRWRREGVRVSSRVLAGEPTLAAWASHLDALRAKAGAESATGSGADVPAVG